jgi:flagellin
MKSDADISSYNNEFKDLQAQLHSIATQKFNGVSLFAQHTEKDGSTEAVFGGTEAQDNTLTVFTSASGSAGSKVSMHKSALLSALTFNTGTLGTALAYSSGANNAAATDPDENPFNMTLAATGAVPKIDLADISVGVLTQALENIATLRAQNGGTHSRLAFNAESLAAQKTNMRAALGRMVDVDIAEETTNLAKYSILNQAAASMLAQANASTDVALMLLR